MKHGIRVVLGRAGAQLSSQPLDLLAPHLGICLGDQKPRLFCELSHEVSDQLGIVVQPFRICGVQQEHGRSVDLLVLSGIVVFLFWAWGLFFSSFFWHLVIFLVLDTFKVATGKPSYSEYYFSS